MFALALIIIVTNIKMPTPILSSMKYFSDASTALSMLYIGSVLYKVFKENKIKLSLMKEFVFVILMKFFILPASLYTLLQFADMPQLLERTFILLSIMPSMNQSVIVSSKYNADINYAIMGTTVTLLFTPIALLCYVMLIQMGYL